MSRFVVSLLVLLCTVPAWGESPGRDDRESVFERKIRPVLAGTCFRCHGGERTGGKLRVDSRENLLKGGDSGPAIVSGNPDESLLVRALRSEDDAPHMPPGKPLAPEAIRDVEAWIRDGAYWPSGRSEAFTHRKHWAFEPLRRAQPDGTSDNPFDRFIDGALQVHHLRPSAPADKRTLLRRATFDLTGLPPTPDDVAAFLADDRPDAFARVVDRLLASPQYGERWGRHWLDLVRYADTAGETADYPVPQAWRYRDYVIDAFNRDKPYDQFLREQLAGDILAAKLPAAAGPQRYAECVIATGYLAVARRFGFDIAKDQYLTIEDTIDVLGKSVLGLTIACARCHDHKYDPITQSDYYALYGIFESTRYPFPGCEKDKAPRDLVSLVDNRAAKQRSEARTSAEMAYAVAEGAPHDAPIHKRGNPDDLGPEVARRFLQVLGGQTVPAGGGSGRGALAEWLTNPRNPLPARVMVNRIWQHHFGAGLVKTANDFGTRGTPPSHPELLDELAVRFIAGGWSIKAMHRLAMLSRAYQRSSFAEPDVLNADPENTWLARFTRRRLNAEEIRDAILACSGDLDPSPGGAPPFPDPKTWGFTQHAPFAADYDHDHRSVYLMTQRIKRHPFLALFDGADPNSSTEARQTSTVPTQALFFLNDPFVHSKAAHLSARLADLPDDRARVDRAFRRLFARGATDADQQIAARFLARYEAGLPPGDRRSAAWAAWLRVLFASNEFLYVD